MTKIAVLGAGSWGTALANQIAQNQSEVTIWTHRQNQADEINQHHTNQHYLPKAHLRENLKATADMAAAIQGVDMVLMVVPTGAVRSVAKQLAELLKAGQHPIAIAHATKGLEQGSHKLISQMIAEEIPAELRTSISAISGPSHAEGVIQGDLTAVSVAGADQVATSQLQHLLATDTFRTYTNPDLVGAELAGALKNIMAIGSGILIGLGYGANSQAALLTRGLVEIRAVGTALGAKPETFLGLAGIGDLIVTGMSPNSRNYRAGRALGQGQALDQVQADMGMVIEGVNTTAAIYEFAQQKRINIPITTAIYQVLYQGADIRSEIKELMTRPLKSEA
ncbi:NAD(P)H-dependent glycerol-3-phosphate dehydrogenase [Lactobacillaceae bacterium L1_55_11]|nr:NAD(P)H-dependent glycerol-3-phosphate dehydrogenase [Lactobacillaceae bacterium L1_55_11]